jgi:hypothetical protein
MPKNKYGVEYAANPKAAGEALTEFCKEINFAPSWLAAGQWQAAVGIACDQEQGILVAQKGLMVDKDTMLSTAASSLRRTKISGKRDSLVSQAEGDYENEYDEHVIGIFKQACGQYIAGGQIDMTYGQDVTEGRYEGIRTDWGRLADLAQNTAPTLFHHFESMAVENKDSKGKGGVGKTLERRGVQGNIFVTIVTVRFNIHVNIVE